MGMQVLVNENKYLIVDWENVALTLKVAREYNASYRSDPNMFSLERSHMCRD